MAIFDPNAGPVIISSISKGISSQVLQAMQNENPVGACRTDWNRTGACIITVVGHGHGGYVVGYFERLISVVIGYAGKVVLFSDVFDMPTYDSAFRTVTTEVMVKNRDKHEASHLLVQTKLVSMAATVAAAQQTSPHTNYNNRAEFEKVVTKFGLPTKRPLPKQPG
jgi:hypothetical protein